MKRLAALAAALLAVLAAGCGAQAEELGGERYRIPSENLLSNTFAGEYVRFIYGNVAPEGANVVGLVFTGKEVAEAIPGFRSRTQGYLGLVDASPSAVVEPAGPHSNFDDAFAQNVARLDHSGAWTRYADTNYHWQPDSAGLFDLATEDGGWERGDLLPPGCTIAETQDGRNYHSCLFRLRRDGLEYSFRLSGENVVHADAFADFVRAKLDSWKLVGDE